MIGLYVVYFTGAYAAGQGAMDAFWRDLEADARRAMALRGAGVCVQRGHGQRGVGIPVIGLGGVRAAHEGFYFLNFELSLLNHYNSGVHSGQVRREELRVVFGAGSVLFDALQVLKLFAHFHNVRAHRLDPGVQQHGHFKQLIH